MLPLNANNAVVETVHAYISRKLKDMKNLFSAISHQPLLDLLMAYIYLFFFYLSFCLSLLRLSFPMLLMLSYFYFLLFFIFDYSSTNDLWL